MQRLIIIFVPYRARKVDADSVLLNLGFKADLAAQEGAEPINLIALGFSQATLAVNVAATFINPQAKVFPGHSSERGY